jgi:serine/threonine protein kinase/tetratricopeptide (TPR) repeat protein
MIGKTISHFEIVEELGEGGMGTVYKARDLHLDRFVALKILPAHLYAEEETKKRFIREAKAASTLEHPNICTIYEIGDLPGGQMFMAMGYYEGETLDKKLVSGALQIDEAVAIAVQTASGLARAHDKGIIHRDVKPSNIVITPDGHVKILDFGVAKLTDQSALTVAGSTLGTLAYMSPEQAGGLEIDARSDIFSLGVIFYQMITGEHPFKADHEAAMVYRITNDDPLPLEHYRADLPDFYQTLIDRMLEKDMEKRLPSLREFLSELDHSTRINVQTPGSDQATIQSEVMIAGAGDMIGPYRLQERIGVGGMGEVWSAEREKPFHRKVALKILKAGMDTKEVIARFDAERQAMALMDHPCIAKVYDAGTTPTGRPYIAMEFIKGVSISEYCDRYKLDTRQRLELFMFLCDGVQHAHHKAVIHRDLKPSNVLITVVDDKPMPKIIDFGVAKATAQRLTEKTMFTHLGQLIGTPEYMSPEQAELTGEDIDTRTDVYSLGVILYELLAGALPFDSKELREAGFDGIRKKIREVEPPRPSTRVTTLGESSTITAEKRQVEPSALVSQLRGDLDWIIMKALDKDRNRRYPSAAEMAADIERHLSNQPVLASPPSNIYRIKKFVKRHKVGVATASLVVLAVLLGIAGTTIGMIRAIKAERMAREEAEAVKQVSQFLEGLFEVSDPSEARGNSVTAREILDKGAGKIARDLENQPILHARLMTTMGRVYRNLGLYRQSRTLLEDALDIRRDQLGNVNLDVADSEEELGSLLGSIGEFQAAEPLFVNALEVRESLLGPNHPNVARAVSNLANLYRQMREFEKAKPLYERALAIRERTLGAEHVDVSNSLNGLAIVHESMGDYEAALPLYKRALAIRELAYGSDHPQVAISLNNIATLYWMMGDHQTAHPYNTRAREIQEKVLGPDHPDLAHTLNTCAVIHLAAGDLEGTKRIHKRALEIREKNLRHDHPRIIESYYNLACVSALLGETDEAIEFLRESIRRGFAYDVIFDDPDLAPLHGNPDFESLLEIVRNRLRGSE